MNNSKRLQLNVNETIKQAYKKLRTMKNQISLFILNPINACYYIRKDNTYRDHILLCSTNFLFYQYKAFTKIFILIISLINFWRDKKIVYNCGNLLACFYYNTYTILNATLYFSFRFAYFIAISDKHCSSISI